MEVGGGQKEERTEKVRRKEEREGSGRRVKRKERMLR